MSELKIKIWKMTDSEIISEIPPDPNISLFKLEDIIVIYRFPNKRLYKWIGNNAPLNLRNKASQIKEEFLKKYPELTIFREVTIKSGSEPPEFFSVMNFTKEQLMDQIKKELYKLEEKNVIAVKKNGEVKFRVEELNKIKTNINNLVKESLKALYERNLVETLNKNKKIIDLLENFLK